MLRSAVGMTHVLQSRLVMDYITSHFAFIVLGYHLDSYRVVRKWGRGAKSPPTQVTTLIPKTNPVSPPAASCQHPVLNSELVIPTTVTSSMLVAAGEYKHFNCNRYFICWQTISRFKNSNVRGHIAYFNQDFGRKPYGLRLGDKIHIWNYIYRQTGPIFYLFLKHVAWDACARRGIK